MSDVVPAPAPRVLAVEHEQECPPAHFGTWLTDAGCALDVCRPYLGETLPPLGEYDAWVVLGGSMGAHDDADHAWLGPVKDRIREAAVTGVPLLGICLGHQLAAAALGGTVVRNPLGQQVGLYDVGWFAEAHLDALMAPLATPRRGVQWNDDIVRDLPTGAVPLASTGRGELQAARFAPSVWGVQLHPEVDAPMLRSWAAGDREAHEERGIDQETVLAEIDAARGELDAAWRPLAVRLAELAAMTPGRRRSGS